MDGGLNYSDFDIPVDTQVPPADQIFKALNGG